MSLNNPKSKTLSEGIAEKNPKASKITQSAKLTRLRVAVNMDEERQEHERQIRIKTVLEKPKHADGQRGCPGQAL